jgi:ParB-like chromosome segregation protein Spo0J
MTTDLKMTVELWDLDRLIPHPGNAKKHPKEQVEALAGVMRRLGFDQPIVIESDGTIIKGHGRRLAALHNVGLGHEQFSRVPVVVRHDLDKAEAEAARLSDNRVVSSDYDTELLHRALADLNEMHFDLSGLGFTDKELGFLAADLGEMDVSAFVEDIETAVGDQKTANDAKVKEIDASELPLTEAFGFKKLTAIQSRRVRAFMAKLEGETGKKGAGALMHFLDEMGVA